MLHRKISETPRYINEVFFVVDILDRITMVFDGISYTNILGVRTI